MKSKQEDGSNEEGINKDEEDDCASSKDEDSQSDATSSGDEDEFSDDEADNRVMPRIYDYVEWGTKSREAWETKS